MGGRLQVRPVVDNPESLRWIPQDAMMMTVPLLRWIPQEVTALFKPQHLRGGALMKTNVSLPRIVGWDSNSSRGEPLRMMTKTSVSRGARFLAIYSSRTDAL